MPLLADRASDRALAPARSPLYDVDKEPNSTPAKWSELRRTRTQPQTALGPDPRSQRTSRDGRMSRNMEPGDRGLSSGLIHQRSQGCADARGPFGPPCQNATDCAEHACADLESVSIPLATARQTCHSRAIPLDRRGCFQSQPALVRAPQRTSWRVGRAHRQVDSASLLLTRDRRFPPAKQAVPPRLPLGDRGGLHRPARVRHV
jgi:hypothetical protein